MPNDAHPTLGTALTRLLVASADSTRCGSEVRCFFRDPEAHRLEISEARG